MRWALLLLTSCTIDYGPGDEVTGGGGTGGNDGTAAWGECGYPYTATIFEPADGGTYSTTIQTRVRWNEDGVPDRYTSMSDHFSHYFIPTGQTVVQGDGSEISTYQLPAGGTFVFEIGWLCNVQQTGGETAVLAKIEFKTKP